jgi:hypothetical protein
MVKQYESNLNLSNNFGVCPEKKLHLNEMWIDRQAYGHESLHTLHEECIKVQKLNFLMTMQE